MPTDVYEFRVPPVLRVGWGVSQEVGTMVRAWGSRCLVVTSLPGTSDLIQGVRERLAEAGVAADVYDAVIANPTVEVMDQGAALAREFQADVILGVGGGSSMDAAKAIALGATHEGSVWEYRLYGERQITRDVLPVVTVNTTAGTGSHISPVSVLTHSGLKSKFAIVDVRLCPRAGLVDPALTVSVPPRGTAATGFDVFAHAFESIQHPRSSPLVELLGYEALRLVATFLPRAVRDGTDRAAREAMARADTLAGICITNAGTTLPHGLAMAIGGHAPHVMHGEALAAVYPAVARYTWASAPEPYARLYELLADEQPEPGLSLERKAERAPAAIERFLERIGLRSTLASLGVPQAELPGIEADTFKLPDYRMNPRVPDAAEVHRLVEEAAGY
jgi:alcohol dehydrogenase class IV